MSVKKYNILKSIWLICVLMSTLVGYASENPAQILDKTAEKLKKASSVKCSFDMTSSGKNLTGELLTKGSKFKVSLPGMTIWYDGNSIWSYAKNDAETTVWKPTKEELAESNPLLYLSTANDYTVAEGSKGSGSRTLILTPKKRNSGVKKIKVTINTKTMLPTAISIDYNGGSAQVRIKSLNLNVPIPENSFVYDKSHHKGVALTDLR